MRNKTIYLGIFIVLILTSCTETTNNAETKKTSTISEKVDTLKVLSTDSTKLKSSNDTIKNDIAKAQPVKAEKKDVFKIYKNGVRQNLVIAYNDSPQTASEDWVFYSNDLHIYFNETHPVENLMYFSCRPQGISAQDMRNLAKELGFEETYIGYYMISENEKGFTRHQPATYVIKDIYSFFGIEKPVEEQPTEF